MGIDLLVRRSFAIALVATVSVAVGCGGGDSRTGAERRLIAKADAICADSLRATEKVEEDFGADLATASKREVDETAIQRRIAYAEALLDISTPKVERLVALRPPASMRDAFERYLEGERQIYYADVRAAGAAHAVHTGEYVSALGRRRNEQERNVDRADEAGLVECAS